MNNCINDYTDKLCYKVKNGDVIWISKDLVDEYSYIILGEYYLLNDEHKLELYDDQILLCNQLFKLIEITFKINSNRKLYQFWKPTKIIDGYKFQCINLEFGGSNERNIN